ncbi:hypothetical protein ACUVMQ_21240 [Aeromonas veronii]|uniref:hypothetical protein n=1 Tax=Aeromonas veronii TaxID=654 RepID=UPI0040554E93
MFKIKSLVLTLASVTGATTVYATTLSAPTEPVVGFKAVYQNTTGAGSVTGDLKPGATLTVDQAKLQFFDEDGDLLDVANVKYSWVLDGVESSTAASFTIPPGSGVVGKNVTLIVTPVTLTGDPTVGTPLTLTDLSLAGAGGGGANGTITPDAALKPIVTNLQMMGSLIQGSALTATYSFDSNGGEPTDMSTYAWAHKGLSAAGVGVNTIAATGNVPAYTITTADAGEVMEVSVQAANNASQIGNTLTVDANGGGVTDGEDNGSGTGDKAVPYLKIEPTAVAITYTSTATDALNGVDGGRPVAAKDEMTAVITPAAGASPLVSAYTFQWKVAGTNVGTADVGVDTFTPGVDHQGQAVTVEVAPVP